MNLRDRIENNVVIWLLGTLLTGFLAGIGTYKAILEIALLEVISEAEYKELVKRDSDNNMDQPISSQSASLSPGYTVLFSDMRIGAMLDAEENFNPKTNAVRIKFAYPINPLGSVTEENKSDSAMVSFAEHWIEPRETKRVNLGGLGTFEVSVKDHKFDPRHSSVQSVQLTVAKVGS